MRAPFASTWALRRRPRRPTRERRLEAEAPIDEVNVVVDRLRDAHDGDGQLAALDLGDDRHGPPERAVAADDEERPDAELLERVDHLPRILTAAGRPEHGAALLVDVGHGLGREANGRAIVALDEALEAVAEPEDLLAPVGVRQLEDEPTDDVVDAGTEAPAGDDPRAHRRRIEEDLVARPRELEGRQLERHEPAGQLGLLVIEQHVLIRLAHDVHDLGAEARTDGRLELALPQRLHPQIRDFDSLRALRLGQRERQSLARRGTK